MSRSTSVELEHYVFLLCFSINFESFVGNITLMLSLYSLEFQSGKFILLKFCIDILRHLQTTESLHCCIMGYPPNMGWGPWGSRNAKSKPQRARDSFWSVSHVLEILIGGASFGSEMVSVSSTEVEAEKGASEKGILVNSPSQETKPWRRGRPRKDTAKGEETRLSVELSTCPTIEEFVRRPHLSEPIESIDRVDGRRKGRGKAPGPPIESPDK
jgi:hypothetical protein